MLRFKEAYVFIEYAPVVITAFLGALSVIYMCYMLCMNTKEIKTDIKILLLQSLKRY